ncbi:MAG: YjbQ family protein [Candidatus Eisenbacteria bacterium]|nr:YjbQ family protein [Candidatus Eisenbacteria bacterium]
MDTRTVQSREHSQLIDITGEVQSAVDASGVKSGVAWVYCPHTTAGITINENADPDVVRDMLADLDRLVPWKQKYYRHGEGNSAGHVKASLIGFSQAVFVEDGRLVLGTWQGIYFAEFDGPRTRRIMVKVLAAG